MVYSNTPTCFICIAAPVDLSLSLSTCICAKFDDDLGLSCPIEGSNLDELVLTLDRSIIANRPLSSTPTCFISIAAPIDLSLSVMTEDGMLRVCLVHFAFCVFAKKSLTFEVLNID